MKRQALLILLIINHHLFAQNNTTIDVAAPGSSSGYGSVNIINNSEVGIKKTIEVDESRVSGSVFWRNDWNKAIVFLQSGSVVKLRQVKLNLNTNETYFLDSAGIVKAADMNLVNKIIFLDKNDSLKTLAVFQKLNYNGTAFFEVLNGGEYQLLKSTQITLLKKDYDPIAGKDEYSYDAKSKYYIIHGGNLSEMNALNKNQLASIITLSEKDNSWLATNNNKLKKEKDIVDFFNYYGNKN